MKPLPATSVCVHHGFTLIELMISVALGSLIVYTAVAGFRVASTSVTLVNRLALENAIMRSGLEQAYDRMDFWTDCDNPENILEQKLRVPGPNPPLRVAAEITGGYRSGLPFTPMSVAFPLTRDANPELTTGWDPKDTWSVSDSRNWFHGDLSQKCRSYITGGYYSIFCNVKKDHLVTGGGADVWYTYIGISPYGQVKVDHTWYMAGEPGFC